MKIEYLNLIGKQFEAGKQDCFTMVRDFYQQNFDIKMKNYSRPSNWNADQLDLITNIYPQVGFQPVDDWDLRPGDLLATAIGSSNPNHFVIYVGDNQLIQHKYMQLSSIDDYRPAWKMVTCYLLRHPDVPDLRPVLATVSIETLLRNRYEEFINQKTA